ncbi:MAG: hypothetical protein WBA22_12075 [Candidatus Methanofastidiosia archaeon]
MNSFLPLRYEFRFRFQVLIFFPLAKKGCIGFKTFMTNPPPEETELQDLAARNDYCLLKIFSKIAKTRLVTSVHAENDTIITGEIARLIS